MDDVPKAVRDARAMAHRAVTEGVSIPYVSQMRRALYEMADAYEALDARLAKAESKTGPRYRLTVESSDYGPMSSLLEIAQALFGKDAVDWLVRDDAQVTG